MSTAPRVYCDFNDRINRDTYGLRVRGTVADLRCQSIQLAAGLALTLYDYDADEAGNPEWIVVDAIVVNEPGIGLVARVDHDAFRWEPRATHQAVIHWSPEHIRLGLLAGYGTVDPAWLPHDPATGWSLACTFPSPPKTQGSPSMAEVSFLMPEAPHDCLRPGVMLQLFERATLAHATVEIID